VGILLLTIISALKPDPGIGTLLTLCGYAL